MQHIAVRRYRTLCLLSVFVLGFVLSSGAANAIPAFTDQTGQACSACHVGAFGPALTPFGREFKLNGYTMRVGNFSAPISAMAVTSYLHTATDHPPVADFANNNNFSLDEASIFLAGGIDDHFGGFAQATYDGIGKSFAWDNLDLRGTTKTTLDGSNLLLGVSVNNNPGTQDVWNTMPAWGFPYTSSDIAAGPAAATLLSDALAQNVIGGSFYAWWNSSLYAELGAYTSLGTGTLKSLGVDPAETSKLSGAAPYYRLAYQKNFNGQMVELGTFGLLSRLYPGRDTSAGTADRINDYGFDASYQTGLTDGFVSLNASYTNETQNLRASRILGSAANAHDTLHNFRLDGSYYWKNLIGGTVGVFHTSGAQDALLYPDSRTGKPDSSGFLFQIDTAPFANEPSSWGSRLNLRIGAQYTAYTMFNGASSNYDGLGRNASDNNAFRLFAWFAF